MPRVLAYSHDGFGLGHLRRNLNIVTALLERRPATSALLLAGLPGIPGLDLPDGADLVKLPSLRKVDTDTWRPRTLRVEKERLGAMRRALIEAAVSSFEPDLVLVDYMPAGVWGELVPTLERLHARGTSRIVLGLRDVLDAPATTRRCWAESGHADALARFYDHVLVYGDPALFDASAAYGLEDLAPGRVEHVGYTFSQPPSLGSAASRARLGLSPDEKLVVVTAGGGCDAFPLMDLALRGIPLLGSSPRTRVVAITGPLMDLAEVARLEALAASTGAVVRRTSDEMPLLLAAADLVVTMAAYNTLTEAVALGRPVLAMPRMGPSLEQRTRAEAFERRGLLAQVPQGATAHEFARLAEVLLEGPPPLRHPPAFDGLARTVARLESLLDAPPRVQRADVVPHPGPRAAARPAPSRSRQSRA